MVKMKLDKPLLLFLCLVPLQWVKLISLGGGTLKAAHLALLIPPFVLWTKGKAVAPHSSFFPLLALHPLLFLALFLALPVSSNPDLGMEIIVRMTSYYIFGLVIMLWLSTLDFEQLKYTLSRAIFYVLATFLGVFGYYVAVSGTNILSVFSNAISSGNPNFIQYHLFVTVMNKGNLEGLSAEDSIDAAGRHGIMMFFIILLFSRVLLPKVDESKLQLLIGRLLILFVLALIFVSLSRVALLILLCSAILYFSYRFLLSKLSTLTYFALAGAALGVTFYLLFGEKGKIAVILYEKLFVDVVNNPRVFEFLQIIDEINANAFIGAGTGSELDLFGLEAKAPHNLILFWWHQAGFIGLCLSVMTLAVFIAYCLRFWYLSVNCKTASTSHLYLLSAILFVTPIIRMLVAKQGALALTEWIAIAIAITFSNFALKGLAVMPGNARSQTPEYATK